MGRGRTDSVHIHSTRCALDPSVPAQSTAGLSTFACRRRRQRSWHRSFPHVRIHSIDTRVSHRSFQTQGSSVAQTQPANVGIIRRATCERFLPTVRSPGQAWKQIPSLPFFSIPTSVRPRDYDRASVLRLIHECMGLPASPPASSEGSEVDSDSPPSLSTSTVAQHQAPMFNPQLIRIDERTMQLHFTPFYFGKAHSDPLPALHSLRLELSEAMMKPTDELF